MKKLFKDFEAYIEERLEDDSGDLKKYYDYSSKEIIYTKLRNELYPLIAKEHQSLFESFVDSIFDLEYSEIFGAYHVGFIDGIFLNKGTITKKEKRIAKTKK